MKPNENSNANPQRQSGSAPVTCYTYALLLLDTLAVKKFGNMDDLLCAVSAKGRERCVILKWHAGAGQWVVPEVWA